MQPKQGSAPRVGVSPRHLNSFDPIDTLKLKAAVDKKAATVVLQEKVFILEHNIQFSSKNTIQNLCFHFKPGDGSFFPCGYITYKNLSESDVV